MFRKQYIITAFLALTAVFSGCTNLDEEVFSSIPEKDFYKTESEFLAAMVPVYSSMRAMTDWQTGGIWKKQPMYVSLLLRITVCGMMAAFIFACTNIHGRKKIRT